jgi:hypothetical protein
MTFVGVNKSVKYMRQSHDIYIVFVQLLLHFKLHYLSYYA